MNNKYNLFLDDFRHPYSVSEYINSNIRHLYTKLDWVIVKNYKEFTQKINKLGLPEIISFDHDLADEHYTPKKYWNDYNKSKKYQDSKEYKEKTGNDCAKWLIEYCIKNNLNLPVYYIHSMNPVGADNINNTLKDFDKWKI